jgi:DNA-directed RNA polymerase
MNDASIVRMYHLWGKRSNIETASIHDSFFSNIVNAQLSKQALREIYATATEADVILKTLKVMRDQGMSRQSYLYFVSKAREMGLIDLTDPLTRRDILGPMRPGYEFYGIGL